MQNRQKHVKIWKCYIPTFYIPSGLCPWCTRTIYHNAIIFTLRFKTRLNTCTIVLTPRLTLSMAVGVKFTPLAYLYMSRKNYLVRLFAIRWLFLNINLGSESVQKSHCDTWCACTRGTNEMVYKKWVYKMFIF